VCQAGLVNNLNDGMAWGLFPLFFAPRGDLGQIGTLAAIYPAVWGWAARHRGVVRPRRPKGLIARGMWTQALGIVVVARFAASRGFAAGAALLGLGTAMVYPTLLAAIGDVAHPRWRASAVGVYRLWRDLGYAVGALLAGLTAAIAGFRLIARDALNRHDARHHVHPAGVLDVAGLREGHRDLDLLVQGQLLANLRCAIDLEHDLLGTGRIGLAAWTERPSRQRPWQARSRSRSRRSRRVSEPSGARAVALSRSTARPCAPCSSPARATKRRLRAMCGG
jgi:hypothetical protein